MSDIRSYQDLVVWQKTMSLAEDIFKVTAKFPDHQRYVLITQMQRCALSIPSNIAEGRSRHSENDFIYHLNIACDSLSELETQVLLACRLAFLDEITERRLLKCITEIRKMLFGLRSSLKALKPETSNLNPKR